MPNYPLTQTTHLLAIEECQYAIGEEIKCTKFTSCMGLFCKVEGSNNVIGIHLVRVDGNHKEFNVTDIPAVKKILTDNNAQLDTGWVTGCLDTWPGDIKNGFYELFDDDSGARILDKGKGFYSAKVEGAGVKVTFEA